MNFDIKPRTQYLVVAGSHAYGMDTESSDYDLRGWCIPPREYFLTFDKKFEQNDKKACYSKYPFKDLLQIYIEQTGKRRPLDDEQIDHTIFDLRKLFKLATECNPNIIELLYVNAIEILLCTPLAEKLLKCRDLFISARAKYTFQGYAIAQLKRINTHRRWLIKPPDHKPTREEYGLPNKTLIPADQRVAAEKLINEKVRHWLLQEAEIPKTELAMFHNQLKDLIANILSSKDLIVSLKDETDLINTARLAAMQSIELSQNFIAIVQAEKAYHNAKREWDQYMSWKKNRNPDRAKMEKDFGFDGKHASHLIRLLDICEEILLTGSLTVKRPNAEFLKDIRKGAWTYEELMEWVSKKNTRLDTIYEEKQYVVPHKPNINKLSALCQELIEEFI